MVKKIELSGFSDASSRCLHMLPRWLSDGGPDVSWSQMTVGRVDVVNESLYQVHYLEQLQVLRALPLDY